MRLKVDLIVVAGGDLWIRAAKNATKTIPIVMVGVGTDPVKQASLKALPVPAETSPALQTLPELGGKRLELLKEAVPRFPVSRFSTIRPLRALHARSKRCSLSRRVRWGWLFSLGRYEMRTISRGYSLR